MVKNIINTEVVEQLTKQLRDGWSGNVVIGFPSRPAKFIDSFFDDCVKKFADAGWLLKVSHGEWNARELTFLKTASGGYRLDYHPPIPSGHTVILTTKPLPQPTNILLSDECSTCRVKTKELYCYTCQHNAQCLDCWKTAKKCPCCDTPSMTL